MSAATRRGITASLLFLSAAWSAALAADQVESAAARVLARVQIDPSAVSIDVAAQRRLLDSSIRRALDSKASAKPAAEESRLVTAEGRPRG